MTDLPKKVPAPTSERREHVMDVLSQYFTAGRIEMDDMEQRMELAARAQTSEELDAALEGLRAKVPAQAAQPDLVIAEPMGPDRPKGKKLSIAIMSGQNRKGRWFAAPRHTAIAFMGGVVLDFREADLEPGTTEVEVFVMMGGVDIIVPPELDVEVDGFAIMGGLREVALHPSALEHTRNRLRVHARVLMGGVEVKVRARKGAKNADGADGDVLPRKRERKKLR